MFIELLHGIIDKNVLFCACIGIESMYLLTRIHQNGSVRLWLLLLPLLALCGIAGFLVSKGCALLSCGFLVPFIITGIAAIGAGIITGVHKRFNRRSHEQEASFLFFASMTALMIVTAWNNGYAATATVVSGVTSALETWAGYGIGLACFASIGVRLHPSATASRLGGIALFYLSLALAGLAFGGAMGMALR